MVVVVAAAVAAVAVAVVVGLGADANLLLDGLGHVLQNLLGNLDALKKREDEILYFRYTN